MIFMVGIRFTPNPVWFRHGWLRIKKWPSGSNPKSHLDEEIYQRQLRHGIRRIVNHKSSSIPLLVERLLKFHSIQHKGVTNDSRGHGTLQ